MASVRQLSPEHWEVELGAESEVTTEVHMSREQAAKLTALEAAPVPSTRASSRL